MKSSRLSSAIGVLISWVRRQIVDSNIPENLELYPEPATTRLNRRALVVLGVILVAVVLAMVTTLVENNERLRTVQANATKTNPAPEPFWRSQPDGVAVPPETHKDEVREHPPDTGPAPSIEEKPAASIGSMNGRSEQDAGRRRAYEAPSLVGGFGRSRTEVARDASVGRCLKTGTSAPVSDSDSAQRVLAAAQGLVREPDPMVTQNNQVEKREFLDKANVARDEQVNAHFVTPPVSPYEVTAGAVLPAVLVTDTNSDLPGMVTARVRENVYDSVTGAHLLIPQGTVITGVYDSVVSYGQDRLLIAWQRLLPA